MDDLYSATYSLLGIGSRISWHWDTQSPANIYCVEMQ